MAGPLNLENYTIETDETDDELIIAHVASGTTTTLAEGDLAAASLAGDSVTVGADTVTDLTGGNLTVDADGVLNATDTDTTVTWTTTTQATDYQATDMDVVLADASGAAVTVTLPAPAPDVQVLVKKTDGSANAVTVASNGSETIDGAASQDLPNQWDTLEVVSDGTDWFIA